MATKVETERLAILETEMKDVKATLIRIEAKVDSITLVQNEVQTLKSEIGTLKAELIELKHAKTVLNWVVPLVTAVLTAAFTYLVLSKLS